MRRLAGIALTVLVVACASALIVRAAEEYPAVTASVWPQKATVGSRLEYVVTVSGGNIEGIEISLPETREYVPPPDHGTEEASPAVGLLPLYVIHSAERKEEATGRKSSVSLAMSVAYYRTGRHPLPAVEVHGADGVAIGYRVPEVLIEASNPSGDFHEIEPPLDLGGNYYRLLIVIALLGALAAAAYLALRRYESRRKKDTPAPYEIPAIDEFLARMQTLRVLGLVEEGRGEEYVVEASRFFRMFLSRLIGIDAMEMTGLELAASLERHLGQAAFSRLRGDLERITGLWDLAKFAEFAPSPGALGDNLEQAMDLGRRIAREERGGRP
ncbi:MAG TPA: hypothetical protein VLM75_11895 [Spirochaetota bacterium]|nr:hypothetical protein [Spirochaetota bacterium]